jgi:hypothetical protein
VARQVFSRCRPSEMAEHVATVLLQQSDQIASSPVATEVSCRMSAARISGQAAEQVFELARPAGFEPATRCLEGTFEPSRDVAWRRSTSHLAVVIVADCRTASRGVCLHWLPYWLPKI